MSADYTYLFPFEYVNQGARIVIYGAGIMGQEYLRQLSITKYATMVAFIDKNYHAYEGSVVPVYPVEKICELSFDYVVLAFQTKSYVREVMALLTSMEVDEDKIIFTSSRTDAFLSMMFKKNDQIEAKTKFAYESNQISIAVKLSGALGDNIVRKKVLEAFVELVPDCAIDVYSPVAGNFLPALYQGFDNITNFINDGGGIYIYQSPRYTVALTIANFIMLDELHIDDLRVDYPEFCRRMELLQKRCREQEIDFSMPVYTHFMKNIKRGKNFYTSFDYDGVFDIRDKNVHIYVSTDYVADYKKLNLKKYITMNYGNATSMRNENFVAKQWPKKHFELLVQLIKEKCKGIKIVQLGGGDAGKIDDIDMYVLGANMELVKHILKNSLIHIDIEGGLVHLATQLGTKCTVLFGPTQVEYFGYDENINIRAGNCHDCYGMCREINRCARDMDQPECMYSITPEMVMRRVEEYLDKSLRGEISQ